MRSQEGKLGLTLLQKALLVEEQQQQQQGTSDGSKKPSLDEIRAQLAAAGNTSKRLKPKLPGFPKTGAAVAGAAAVGLGAKAGNSDELLFDDDDEDCDDEDESTPAFQITFDERGRAVSKPVTVSAGWGVKAAGSMGTAERRVFHMRLQPAEVEALPVATAGLQGIQGEVPWHASLSRVMQ